MTVQENWKQYITKPGDIVNMLQHFVDDYEVCKEAYDINENGVDDATWVHVDSVKEERDELESKIQKLEDALHNRNCEYNELYEKYRALEKQLKTGKKPVKKLGKKKPKREDILNITDDYEDDDIPF